VSPSRPSLSPQAQVYARASSDSTFERLPSRTNLIGPLPKPDLNSRPLNRLRPLSHCEKSQLLWNQANPASFSETPGVGVSLPLISPLVYPDLRGVTRHSPPPLYDCEPRSRRSLTPFRINTCKSVSKQKTLSTCTINTYAKTGGGGPPAVGMDRAHP